MKREKKMNGGGHVNQISIFHNANRLLYEEWLHALYLNDERNFFNLARHENENRDRRRRQAEERNVNAL